MKRFSSSRDTAAEVFGVFKVPVAAGSSSKISRARIIYPDGSYADFNRGFKRFFSFGNVQRPAAGLCAAAGFAKWKSRLRDNCRIMTTIYVYKPISR